MRQGEPSGAEIRASLDAVIASETFSRSARAREFLRYLVENQLDGRADRLKGYSIALDVFDRDTEFDPSTDAVVRVQAGRLRELLEQYYDGEGSDSGLRINVPRGCYVPRYEILDRTDVPDEVLPASDALFPEPETPEPVAKRWQRRFVGAMAGALLVVLVTGGMILQSLVPGSRAAESEVYFVSAQMNALPEIFIRSNAPSSEAVDSAAALLRGAIAGFDTVTLLAAGEPSSLGTERAWRQFVFELRPDSMRGFVNIAVLSAGWGKVVHARRIDTAKLDQEVANLLTALLPASGSIYAFLSENDAHTDMTRCLLLNDDYYRHPGEERHRLAYDCFEALIAAGSRSPLAYSELAALHLRTVVNQYPFPANASQAGAFDLAKLGIQFGPTSPYAHRAHGYLLQRMGDQGESIRWMQRAYELNTYDLSMAAAYGYGLIMSGRYSQGVPVLDRAILASSAHPAWWSYTLFLGAFMIEDYALAERALATLTAENRDNYIAARLILATKRAGPRAAEDLRTELINRPSSLALNPRAYYQEANYPPDLIERLVETLHKAGLSSGS